MIHEVYGAESPDDTPVLQWQTYIDAGGNALWQCKLKGTQNSWHTVMVVYTGGKGARACHLPNHLGLETDIENRLLLTN